MDLDSDGVVSFEEIHGGSDLEPIDEEDRKELERLGCLGLVRFHCAYP